MFLCQADDKQDNELPPVHDQIFLPRVYLPVGKGTVEYDCAFNDTCWHFWASAFFDLHVLLKLFEVYICKDSRRLFAAISACPAILMDL